MRFPSLSRRQFLKAASAVTATIAISKLPPEAAASTAHSDISELPLGPECSPLSFSHFPDRLHAFVWRNWQLVPLERMALVVGARKADIFQIGKAMGLDRPPSITADQQRRSYITVIKRNWHLLPYEQLVQLLGWGPGKLAYTLREDDFLFVKLGNAKPRCAPLRYEAPGPEVRARRTQIAKAVREFFSSGSVCGAQPLFKFLSDLKKKPGRARPVRRSENLRFCYSYSALYGDPLLEPEADPYPEGLLARLAQGGVNGVWMQAVLYKLSPFPWEPEQSSGYQARLRNLRDLVRRAAKHGIEIFLYLNEPRAMPLSFFSSHPDLKGVVEGEYATLCTSVPQVQQYISDGIHKICRAVPGLGGFFSISASENLTNCWSHGAGPKCPRCATRTPASVIAEVNRLFQQGIDRSGKSVKLLVWDWGWNNGWAEDVIRELPPAARLMSVSEWRLPIERGGIKTEVGEYSLSAIGPGPRAQKHWKAARERGLKIVAKIQASNTWELSTLPWIPAVENAAQHAENLSRLGVKDLMLGWTLGGYPSPNLEVVSKALESGSAQQALTEVAEERFGAGLAPRVVRAWEQCSAGFREFPYHIGVVYSGPQQLGPANLLWQEQTGYHASMVGFPYDDLDAWRAVYPAEIYISQLEKVANGFAGAFKELGRAIREPLSRGAAAQSEALQSEMRMMEAAAIHFRSCANQARFTLARNTAKAQGRLGDAHSGEMKAVLDSEIALACRLHQLQSLDTRLGFEASNHYFYVPMDLVEKVLNCRYLQHALGA